MENNNEASHVPMRTGFSKILDCRRNDAPDMDDDFGSEKYSLESSDSDDSYAAPPPPLKTPAENNGSKPSRMRSSSSSDDFEPPKYEDSCESYGSLADLGAPTQPKIQVTLPKKRDGRRTLGIKAMDTDSDGSIDGVEYESSEEEEAARKPTEEGKKLFNSGTANMQNKNRPTSAFNTRSQRLTDIVGPKDPMEKEATSEVQKKNDVHERTSKLADKKKEANNPQPKETKTSMKSGILGRPLKAPNVEEERAFVKALTAKQTVDVRPKSADRKVLPLKKGRELGPVGKHRAASANDIENDRAWFRALAEDQRTLTSTPAVDEKVFESKIVGEPLQPMVNNYQDPNAIEREKQFFKNMVAGQARTAQLETHSGLEVDRKVLASRKVGQKLQQTLFKNHADAEEEIAFFKGIAKEQIQAHNASTNKEPISGLDLDRKVLESKVVGSRLSSFQSMGDEQTILQEERARIRQMQADNTPTDKPADKPTDEPSGLDLDRKVLSSKNVGAPVDESAMTADQKFFAKHANLLHPPSYYSSFENTKKKKNKKNKKDKSKEKLQTENNAIQPKVTNNLRDVSRAMLKESKSCKDKFLNKVAAPTPVNTAAAKAKSEEAAAQMSSILAHAGGMLDSRPTQETANSLYKIGGPDPTQVVEKRDDAKQFKSNNLYKIGGPDPIPPQPSVEDGRLSPQVQEMMANAPPFSFLCPPPNMIDARELEARFMEAQSALEEEHIRRQEEAIQKQRDIFAQIKEECSDDASSLEEMLKKEAENHRLAQEQLAEQHARDIEQFHMQYQMEMQQIGAHEAAMGSDMANYQAMQEQIYYGEQNTGFGYITQEQAQIADQELAAAIKMTQADKQYPEGLTFQEKMEYEQERQRCEHALKVTRERMAAGELIIGDERPPEPTMKDTRTKLEKMEDERQKQMQIYAMERAVEEMKGASEPGMFKMPDGNVYVVTPDGDVIPEEVLAYEHQMAQMAQMQEMAMMERAYNEQMMEQMARDGMPQQGQPWQRSSDYDGYYKHEQDAGPVGKIDINGMSMPGKKVLDKNSNHDIQERLDANTAKGPSQAVFQEESPPVRTGLRREKMARSSLGPQHDARMNQPRGHPVAMDTDRNSRSNHLLTRADKQMKGVKDEEIYQGEEVQPRHAKLKRQSSHHAESMREANPLDAFAMRCQDQEMADMQCQQHAIPRGTPLRCNDRERDRAQKMAEGNSLDAFAARTEEKEMLESRERAMNGGNRQERKKKEQAMAPSDPLDAFAMRCVEKEIQEEEIKQMTPYEREMALHSGFIPPEMVPPEMLPPGMMPPGRMPPGMMPPGMMPPGMMHQGMGPPEMMQPGMVPPAMMPPGMVPPGMMHPGMMPPGMVPREMMPPGMVPPEMMPPGMMPPGMIPPGMVPQGMLPSGILMTDENPEAQKQCASKTRETQASVDPVEKAVPTRTGLRRGKMARQSLGEQHDANMAQRRDNIQNNNTKRHSRALSLLAKAEAQSRDPSVIKEEITKQDTAEQDKEKEETEKQEKIHEEAKQKWLKSEKTERKTDITSLDVPEGSPENDKHIENQTKAKDETSNETPISYAKALQSNSPSQVFCGLRRQKVSNTLDPQRKNDALHMGPRGKFPKGGSDQTHARAHSLLAKLGDYTVTKSSDQKKEKQTKKTRERARVKSAKKAKNLERNANGKINPFRSGRGVTDTSSEDDSSSDESTAHSNSSISSVSHDNQFEEKPKSQDQDNLDDDEQAKKVKVQSKIATNEEKMKKKKLKIDSQDELSDIDSVGDVSSYVPSDEEVEKDKRADMHLNASDKGKEGHEVIGEQLKNTDIATKADERKGLNNEKILSEHIKQREGKTNTATIQKSNKKESDNEEMEIAETKKMPQKKKLRIDSSDEISDVESVGDVSSYVPSDVEIEKNISKQKITETTLEEKNEGDVKEAHKEIVKDVNSAKIVEKVEQKYVEENHDEQPKEGKIKMVKRAVPKPCLDDSISEDFKMELPTKTAQKKNLKIDSSDEMSDVDTVSDVSSYVPSDVAVTVKKGKETPPVESDVGAMQVAKNKNEEVTDKQNNIGAFKSKQSQEDAKSVSEETPVKKTEKNLANRIEGASTVEATKEENESIAEEILEVKPKTTTNYNQTTYEAIPKNSEDDSIAESVKEDIVGTAQPRHKQPTETEKSATARSLSEAREVSEHKPSVNKPTADIKHEINEEKPLDKSSDVKSVIESVNKTKQNVSANKDSEHKSEAESIQEDSAIDSKPKHQKQQMKETVVSEHSASNVSSESEKISEHKAQQNRKDNKTVEKDHEAVESIEEELSKPKPVAFECEKSRHLQYFCLRGSESLSDIESLEDEEVPLDDLMKPPVFKEPTHSKPAPKHKEPVYKQAGAGDSFSSDTDSEEESSEEMSGNALDLDSDNESDNKTEHSTFKPKDSACDIKKETAIVTKDNTRHITDEKGQRRDEKGQIKQEQKKNFMTQEVKQPNAAVDSKTNKRGMKTPTASLEEKKVAETQNASDSSKTQSKGSSDLSPKSVSIKKCTKTKDFECLDKSPSNTDLLLKNDLPIGKVNSDINTPTINTLAKPKPNTSETALNKAALDKTIHEKMSAIANSEYSDKHEKYIPTKTKVLEESLTGEQDTKAILQTQSKDNSESSLKSVSIKKCTKAKHLDLVPSDVKQAANSEAYYNNDLPISNVRSNENIPTSAATPKTKANTSDTALNNNVLDTMRHDKMGGLKGNESSSKLGQAAPLKTKANTETFSQEHPADSKDSSESTVKSVSIKKRTKEKHLDCLDTSEAKPSANSTGFYNHDRPILNVKSDENVLTSKCIPQTKLNTSDIAFKNERIDQARYEQNRQTEKEPSEKQRQSVLAKTSSMETLNRGQTDNPKTGLQASSKDSSESSVKSVSIKKCTKAKQLDKSHEKPPAYSELSFNSDRPIANVKSDGNVATTDAMPRTKANISDTALSNDVAAKVKYENISAITMKPDSSENQEKSVPIKTNSLAESLTREQIVDSNPNAHTKSEEPVNESNINAAVKSLKQESFSDSNKKMPVVKIKQEQSEDLIQKSSTDNIELKQSSGSKSKVSAETAKQKQSINTIKVDRGNLDDVNNQNVTVTSSQKEIGLGIDDMVQNARKDKANVKSFVLIKNEDHMPTKAESTSNTHEREKDHKGIVSSSPDNSFKSKSLEMRQPKVLKESKAMRDLTANDSQNVSPQHCATNDDTIRFHDNVPLGSSSSVPAVEDKESSENNIKSDPININNKPPIEIGGSIRGEQNNQMENVKSDSKSSCQSQIPEVGHEVQQLKNEDITIKNKRRDVQPLKQTGGVAYPINENETSQVADANDFAHRTNEAQVQQTKHKSLAHANEDSGRRESKPKDDRAAHLDNKESRAHAKHAERKDIDDAHPNRGTEVQKDKYAKTDLADQIKSNDMKQTKHADDVSAHLSNDGEIQERGHADSDVLHTNITSKMQHTQNTSAASPYQNKQTEIKQERQINENTAEFPDDRSDSQPEECTLAHSVYPIKGKQEQPNVRMHSTGVQAFKEGDMKDLKSANAGTAYPNKANEVQPTESAKSNVAYSNEGIKQNKGADVVTLITDRAGQHTKGAVPEQRHKNEPELSKQADHNQTITQFAHAELASEVQKGGQEDTAETAKSNNYEGVEVQENQIGTDIVRPNKRNGVQKAETHTADGVYTSRELQVKQVNHINADDEHPNKVGEMQETEEHYAASVHTDKGMKVNQTKQRISNIAHPKDRCGAQQATVDTADGDHLYREADVKQANQTFVDDAHRNKGSEVTQRKPGTHSYEVQQTEYSDVDHGYPTDGSKEQHSMHIKDTDEYLNKESENKQPNQNAYHVANPHKASKIHGKHPDVADFTSQNKSKVHQGNKVDEVAYQSRDRNVQPAKHKHADAAYSGKESAVNQTKRVEFKVASPSKERYMQQDDQTQSDSAGDSDNKYNVQHRDAAYLREENQIESVKPKDTSVVNKNQTFNPKKIREPLGKERKKEMREVETVSKKNVDGTIQHKKKPVGKCDGKSPTSQNKYNITSHESVNTEEYKDVQNEIEDTKRSRVDDLFDSYKASLNSRIDKAFSDMKQKSTAAAVNKADQKGNVSEKSKQKSQKTVGHNVVLKKPNNTSEHRQSPTETKRDNTSLSKSSMRNPISRRAEPGTEQKAKVPAKRDSVSKKCSEENSNRIEGIRNAFKSVREKNNVKGVAITGQLDKTRNADNQSKKSIKELLAKVRQDEVTVEKTTHQGLSSSANEDVHLKSDEYSHSSSYRDESNDRKSAGVTFKDNRKHRVEGLTTSVKLSEESRDSTFSDVAYEALPGNNSLTASEREYFNAMKTRVDSRDALGGRYSNGKLARNSYDSAFNEMDLEELPGNNSLPEEERSHLSSTENRCGSSNMQIYNQDTAFNETYHEKLPGNNSLPTGDRDHIVSTENRRNSRNLQENSYDSVFNTDEAMPGNNSLPMGDKGNLIATEHRSDSGNLQRSSYDSAFNEPDFEALPGNNSLRAGDKYPLMSKQRMRDSQNMQRESNDSAFNETYYESLHGNNSLHANARGPLMGAESRSDCRNHRENRYGSGFNETDYEELPGNNPLNAGNRGQLISAKNTSSSKHQNPRLTSTDTPLKKEENHTFNEVEYEALPGNNSLSTRKTETIKHQSKERRQQTNTTGNDKMEETVDQLTNMIMSKMIEGSNATSQKAGNSSSRTKTTDAIMKKSGVSYSHVESRYKNTFSSRPPSTKLQHKETPITKQKPLAMKKVEAKVKDRTVTAYEKRSSTRDTTNNISKISPAKQPKAKAHQEVKTTPRWNNASPKKIQKAPLNPKSIKQSSHNKETPSKGLTEPKAVKQKVLQKPSPRSLGKEEVLQRRRVESEFRTSTKAPSKEALQKDKVIPRQIASSKSNEEKSQSPVRDRSVYHRSEQDKSRKIVTKADKHDTSQIALKSPVADRHTIPKGLKQDSRASVKRALSPRKPISNSQKTAPKSSVSKGAPNAQRQKHEDATKSSRSFGLMPHKATVQRKEKDNITKSPRNVTSRVNSHGTHVARNVREPTSKIATAVASTSIAPKTVPRNIKEDKITSIRTKRSIAKCQDTRTPKTTEVSSMCPRTATVTVAATHNDVTHNGGTHDVGPAALSILTSTPSNGKRLASTSPKVRVSSGKSTTKLDTAESRYKHSAKVDVCNSQRAATITKAKNNDSTTVDGYESSHDSFYSDSFVASTYEQNKSVQHASEKRSHRSSAKRTSVMQQKEGYSKIERRNSISYNKEDISQDSDMIRSKEKEEYSKIERRNSISHNKDYIFQDIDMTRSHDDPSISSVNETAGHRESAASRESSERETGAPRGTTSKRITKTKSQRIDDFSYDSSQSEDEHNERSVDDELHRCSGKKSKSDELLNSERSRSDALSSYAQEEQRPNELYSCASETSQSLDMPSSRYDKKSKSHRKLEVSFSSSKRSLSRTNSKKAAGDIISYRSKEDFSIDSQSEYKSDLSRAGYSSDFDEVSIVSDSLNSEIQKAVMKCESVSDADSYRSKFADSCSSYLSGSCSTKAPIKSCRNDLRAFLNELNDEKTPVIKSTEENSVRADSEIISKSPKLPGKKAFAHIKSKLLESPAYQKPMVLSSAEYKAYKSESKGASKIHVHTDDTPTEQKDDFKDSYSSDRRHDSTVVLYSNRDVDIRNKVHSPGPLKAKHDIIMKETVYKPIEKSTVFSKSPKQVASSVKYNIITHEALREPNVQRNKPTLSRRVYEECMPAQYISHRQMDLSNVRAKIDCNNNYNTKRSTNEHPMTVQMNHPQVDLTNVESKVDCHYDLQVKRDHTNYVSHFDEDYADIDAKIETHNNFKLIRRDVDYVQHIESDYSHVKSKIDTTWKKTPYSKALKEVTTKDIRTKLRSNMSKSKSEPCSKIRDIDSPYKQNCVSATQNSESKKVKDSKNNSIKSKTSPHSAPSKSHKKKVKKSKSKGPLKANHDIPCAAPTAPVHSAADHEEKQVSRPPIQHKSDFFYPISAPFVPMHMTRSKSLNQNQNGALRASNALFHHEKAPVEGAYPNSNTGRYDSNKSFKDFRSNCSEYAPSTYSDIVESQSANRNNSKYIDYEPMNKCVDHKAARIESLETKVGKSVRFINCHFNFNGDFIM